MVRQGEEKGDNEASMSLSLPVVGPFDVLSESANVGVRWEKWINSFKLYLAASGIREASRKRALLLHLAGPDIQDIFFTLEGRVRRSGKLIKCILHASEEHSL